MMWKGRRFFILFVGLGGILFSCSCRNGFGRHLSHQATGRWLSPYVTDTPVEAPPRLAMLALLASLRACSVSSVSWDIEGGVVVWTDTGEHFSPIYSGVPSPTEHIAGVGIHVTGGWHGHVFGCARVTALGDNAWLYVRARGRSLDEETHFYSNGVYEKRLISMVRWQAEAYNTGVAQLPDFAPVRFEPISSLTWDGKPLAVSASGLRAAIEHEEVGWAAQEVWLACFSLLMQKGILLHVNPKEKILVLLGQQVVEGGDTAESKPANPQTPQRTRQDVIILAHVTRAGNNASWLYIAYLDDEGELRHVPRRSLDQGQDALEELAGTRPVEIAAARICREFETLLARQLTYREWRDKLTRRMVVRE